ncbi:hypothetical protein PHMEG_00028842 [Phytophthora megakarya]|uniref:Uncharacterized protein n=1 Tax=Phytophthora megakarya TaxID=4795 RepID=A0A225V3H6_9STRA|nr:hypothetical protein PHMEG_00028842 [Phytophthora megakarya]
MSFLLGDDYASSESESEEEETVASNAVEQEVEKEKAPAQLLPSVDSVLSSVSASTASFLPPKSSTKTQSTVESFDLLEEQKRHKVQKEKEQEKQMMECKVTIDTNRNDRKRAAPQMTRELKRDKKDAKERVKNQRLKGQAGIGSDFRGWKSETEMALRQQFD